MSKDREYDEKMGLSRAGRPAIDSYAETKLRKNATGDSYSEIKLRQNAKSRTKASDTSKMNKIYKPKASPGPVINYYGQSFSIPKPNTSQSFSIKKPAQSKSTKLNTAAKPKAKSKNVAGFKPGSIGAKAITSFKKAYLGE